MSQMLSWNHRIPSGARTRSLTWFEANWFQGIRAEKLHKSGHWNGDYGCYLSSSSCRNDYCVHRDYVWSWDLAPDPLPPRMHEQFGVWVSNSASVSSILNLGLIHLGVFFYLYSFCWRCATTAWHIMGNKASRLVDSKPFIRLIRFPGREKHGPCFPKSKSRIPIHPLLHLRCWRPVLFFAISLDRIRVNWTGTFLFVVRVYLTNCALDERRWAGHVEGQRAPVSKPEEDLSSIGHRFEIRIDTSVWCSENIDPVAVLKGSNTSSWNHDHSWEISLWCGE